MPLHIDQRPKTLKDFYGNESLKQSLLSVLQRKNPPRTFLFSGPAGCGKTTLARIIANMEGCQGLDYLEIDVGDSRGIDDARNIKTTVKYSPLDLESKCKVYCLDECFAPGTTVIIPGGVIPIELIIEGQKILNLFGEDIVECVFKNKVPLFRVIKLSFSDGIETFCSTDHEYMTNVGWKKAVELKGMEVYYGRALEARNRENLCSLSENFYHEKSQTKDLLSFLLREIGYSESIRSYEKRNFSSYAFEQSYELSRKYRENVRNQKKKWNSSTLERAWREWKTYRSSNFISQLSWMGGGNSYIYQTSPDWLPNQLQIGYWKRHLENWNRSRWTWPQRETEIIRQKEGREIERVRVESVEIYQPGGNNKSFSSIIGDTERNQGFIYFYDLQIKNLHSYFANGHLVHNCHQANDFFQSAMLKILEEPPKHVRFILCTTNPDKLKTTVKRRCHSFDLQPLPGPIMREFILSILQKEGVVPEEGYPEEVLSELIKVSDGSPGIAMKNLDQIIDMDSYEAMVEFIQRSYTTETTISNLCKALLAKSKWFTIAPIVKGLSAESTDYEKIRYAVLGWATSTLLNSGNSQAAVMIEKFQDPWYNSGRAGLALAAWRCTL